MIGRPSCRTAWGIEGMEPRVCPSAVAFVPRLLVDFDLSVQDAAAIDFDHDHDLDLMVAYDGGHGIAWYERIDTSGNYRAHLVGQGDELRNAYPVDVDGDGDYDVVALSRSLNVLAWFENDGLGNFPHGGFPDEWGHVILDDSRGESGFAMVPADVDGDGDVDLIASYTGGTNFLAWFENIDGRATFSPGRSIEKEPLFYTSIDVADVDRDGAVDLVAAGASFNGHNVVYWYENQGSGIFSRHAVHDSVEQPFQPPLPEVKTGDIDGDGDVDIAATLPWHDSLVWFENVNSAGSFDVGHTITSNAPRMFALALSDLDGDGDLDALSSESYSGARTLAWFENSNGNFGSRQIMAQGFSAGRLAAADLDGDGDLDAFMAGGQNSVVYLEQRVIGDVNDDGVFGTDDLVSVLQAGEYEDGVTRNSDFDEGDWNGDGEFDSADLVLGFQAGNYVAAARPSAAAYAGAVDWLMAQEVVMKRRR